MATDLHPHRPSPTRLVRGVVGIQLRFEADVLRLARCHRSLYGTYPLPGTGFQEWEGAGPFLWDLIYGSLVIALGDLDGLRGDHLGEEPDISFRWSRALADELAERLGDPITRPVEGEQHLFEPPAPVAIKPSSQMLVTGTVKAKLRFVVDPKRLAAVRAEELAAHPPPSQGYEPWEALATLVHQLVEDHVEAYLVEQDGLRDTTVNGLAVDFHWTGDMAEEFDCPR